jgi:hypothetical protein
MFLFQPPVNVMVEMHGPAQPMIKEPRVDVVTTGPADMDVTDVSGLFTVEINDSVFWTKMKVTPDEAVPVQPLKAA